MMWDGDLSSFPEENYRKFRDSICPGNPIGSLADREALGFSDSQSPSLGESPVTRRIESLWRTGLGAVGIGSVGVYLVDKLGDALWGRMFDSLLDGTMSIISHLF